MEYYGATISSLWALRHELFHMYFGCSVVFRTYRDSWLDEAITQWYDDTFHDSVYPIWDTYQSNIVSGRSPIAVGFDRRAYYEGVQMMEKISQLMGGKEEMFRFLSHVYSNHTFNPLYTLEFSDLLKNYSGLDLKEDFKRWVFSGETVGASPASSDWVLEKHRVEIVPPRLTNTVGED